MSNIIQKTPTLIAQLSFDSQNQNFKSLFEHCLKKGIQLGSVLGIAVFAPILLYKRHRAGLPTQLRNFAKSQIYALLLGTGASLGMMFGKYLSWENKAECLKDRAYRIHHNYLQNRVDEITTKALFWSYGFAVVWTWHPILSIGLITPAVTAGLLYHALTTKSVLGQRNKDNQNINGKEIIQKKLI